MSFTDPSIVYVDADSETVVCGPIYAVPTHLLTEECYVNADLLLEVTKAHGVVVAEAGR